MSFILNASPGQTVTLVFQTLDGYGQRADGYAPPAITRIIFPNLSLASGYPQNMTRLDVGLYNFKVILPPLAASVGSYIVDVSYIDPATMHVQMTFFQIVVSAPFGQYSATTF
jgi:hypothetical protein